MNKENIEQRIEKAIISTMPEMDFNKILIECKKEKTIMKFNMKTILGFATATLAAVCLFIANPFAPNNPYMSVSFDVNPSVTLDIDEMENVTEVHYHNEDADNVLENIELKGKNIYDATDIVIDVMIENGFISETSNSVLLSIDGEDSNQLQEVTKNVENVITQKVPSASLLVVEVENDELEYEISSGKGQLINEIIAVDSTLVFDELVDMNVNELNLLLQSKHVTDIEQKGTPNSSKYISEEAALTSFANHLGVNTTALTDVEIDFDVEDGNFVYEIEFNYNGKEYEGHVEAVTGVFVTSSLEKESIDIDDLDDDNDDDNDDDSDDDNDDNDDDDNDDDSDDDNDDNDDLDDDSDDDSDDNDDIDDLDDDNDDDDNDDNSDDDDNDDDSDDDDDDDDDNDD